MTGKEAKSVYDCIENEGFDYCFINYSNFEEIKDEEFHKLRENFINARKLLSEYVGCDN